MEGTTEGQSGQKPSRRERMRTQLIQEARREARQLLASEGLAGLSLSAVARSLGVSPPALYRYFDGKAGLVTAVYEDLTAELVDSMRSAVLRQDSDDTAAHLYAATEAVLVWSVAHQTEFSLLVGTFYQRAAANDESTGTLFVREVGAVYVPPFRRLSTSGKLNYPCEEDIPVALRGQLVAYRDGMDPDLPLGVVYLMITCWRQIYGMVCMAVHEHLAFAFDDWRPLFEDMMRRLLEMLGLDGAPTIR
ncbi:TetR/AcrR family transcriptional regulator [Streptomyces sp. NPDC060030]|uniref:TetR/AcrR family transcriptional regulator n=1 Tax=Streptomyces sp. NPDC060030 TaxID=3347042 RepID=UPI00367654A9